MHKVNLATHTWVEHRVHPVDILYDPFDDSIMVIPKENKVEPEPVAGCSTCGVALSFDAISTPCSG